ncbi:hypothetical protein F2Q68_00002288 [Brassica cretica]|uniref:Uncharacterized protein n=1 Tax=Brassica cretica TaxID=69181 RepID=A0A8S9JBK7_BRACR|nr:hypothetical protein F2Q68_00002288 [Brassica cretica]
MALASGRHGARQHSTTSSPGVATRHFKPSSSLPLKRMTSSFHVLDDVGPHNNNNLLTDKQMYPKMTSSNTMTMFG